MTTKKINMSRRLVWLHVSDIHFLPKTMWRDNESRRTLLNQLTDIFAATPELRPQLIFCTGDIAFGQGSGSTLLDQYSDAKDFFDSLLKVCGITGIPLSKERLFIVPGNHDINRNSVNRDAQNTLVEKARDSNRFVSEINERFSNKSIEFIDANKRLAEYSKFVLDYLPHQTDPDQRNVYNAKLSVDGLDVEIFGFNSAWTAAGPEDDRNLWLAATSQFNIASARFAMRDIRIGIIHHPTEWLALADRKVATARIQSDFDFWLHGHTHDAWITVTPANITIGAGAIGAESSEEFGFNLTAVDLEKMSGESHLYSKETSGAGWTIHPIAHVAPTGVWKYQLPSRISITETKKIDQNGVALRTKKLVEDLDECLRSYTTQHAIWVDPHLSHQAETSHSNSTSDRLEIDEILATPCNRLVIAAPQFGLTCLMRQLSLRAWRDFAQLWLYVDLSGVNPNKAAILKKVNSELARLDASIADLVSILIDGGSDANSFTKSVRILDQLFPHVLLVCSYQRATEIEIVPDELLEVRDFDICYLWSLSRTQIRQVVAIYNREKFIGEEDVVTARLSSDLEVLNLHRTPLNCLTLLKVSEADFDENPVNRSEMIKRILFLIFNIDPIPTYKSRPDLKDCEFVLGYFCQSLIERQNYIFSRAQFISDIERFCNQQLIDLEIHVVFDVLFDNRIIVSFGTQFSFKFSYWILYFAAQRMHQDAPFAEYVLSDAKYAQYPEIIEFYTGIDRKKDSALRLITEDVLAAVAAVKKITGLPDDLNPFRLDIWKATTAGEAAMQQVVAEGVKESTLPTEIKDNYADSGYNRSRPYNQNIAKFLTEQSFASMYKLIRAAARALRNSDYASPEIKRELLTAILLAWEETSRVILVILPALSTERRASFDGQVFTLQVSGTEVRDPAEVAISILKAIPNNIIKWFSDDIYSQKMSPLLRERVFDSGAPDLSRHELALLLIQKRPRGWEGAIHKYISDLKKDSYYLLHIFQELRWEYEYGFASKAVLKEIEHLIKMVATKHLTGVKEPGIKAIGKIKFDAGLIPKRENPERLD